MSLDRRTKSGKGSWVAIGVAVAVEIGLFGKSKKEK